MPGQGYLDAICKTPTCPIPAGPARNAPVRRSIQQDIRASNRDTKMNTTYSTADTALLLVDLLNDFLDEKGKLAQRIGPMLEKTDLIAHLQRLVKGARAAG